MGDPKQVSESQAFRLRAQRDLNGVASTRIPEGCVIWSVITNFGDSAVMIPAAFAIAGWLALNRVYVAAAAWLLFLGAAGSAVLVTKIAYIGWGVGVPQLDFAGISGHAMGSTATLSIMGYFAASGQGKTFATAGAVTGMVAGLIVGLSRVILGFHSSSEVIAGCALGAAVAVASAYFVETRPRSFVQSIVFVGAMVALMGLLHGGKAPSEAMITKIALYLSGRTVPFYSHGRWS